MKPFPSQMPPPLPRVWLLPCVLLLSATLTGGAEPNRATKIKPDHAARMQAGLKLFQQHVRATLEKHCVECHHGRNPKGDFDISTREALMDSGVVGVTAQESHFLELIQHETEPHMPFKRAKLAPKTIARIAQWIDLGAPYDGPLGSAKDSFVETQVTDKQRQFWSFRPLQATVIPPCDRSDWPNTPIDCFVLRGLSTADLTPSPSADRRVLMRRVYSDVLGMTPSPAELELFLNDRRPDAYDRLIDRLLCDPRYGERWGRHWLDVARFAESGGFEHDDDRPQAFHYRDFVIRALNLDMPYDQFVKWQLAGDESAPDDHAALVATGFLAAGVFPSQITETEFERTRYDQIDDMIATSGVAFLGLTIGCARCHDHKFDPIPTEDYYRVAANFTKVIPALIDADWSRQPHMRPPGTDDQLKQLLITTEGLPPVKSHAEGRGYKHFYDKMYLLRRGDPAAKVREVQPGFLQVLLPSDAAPQTTPPADHAERRTSGQRLGFARWLIDDVQGAGHLAARVMVNRVWQHHLGRGIVGTPNDFGMQGDRPSHPELLDWLAARLIQEHWQLKPIHRLILTSSVYRQKSTLRADAAKVDPENRLYWRFPYRRLDAEAIRDTVLNVSGLLDHTMFGPGSLDSNMRRRSIYFTVKRSKMVPTLQLFDMPEPLVSIGARTRTTIAPQALMFLNGKQIRQASEVLARRLETRTGSADDVSWERFIDAGYRHTLGRTATDREIALHTHQLDLDVAEFAAANERNSRQLAQTNFCQLLFSLNEFVYSE